MAGDERPAAVLPVNALERIEVIRSPGSVLYGTNAFSGVINLITKKARGQSAMLRTYGVGTAGSGASGEIMMERGKLSVMAAGQLRFDPAWTTAYGDAYQRPVFQNAEIQNRGPGALMRAEYKHLHVMGGYTEWQSSFFARDIGENRWRRGFANVGYSLAPSVKWDMTLNLTHTANWLTATGPPDIRRASTDTVLEWTNFIQPTTRDQITLGALYDYTKGREWAYGSTLAAGSRNSAGFYAQLEHRLTEELKFVGGLQPNKIGPLELNTVPRVGLLWSPRQRVHLKALYGRAFRAPSIHENRLNHAFVQGNPDLAPERVGTLDLGVSYQSDRLLVAINYFDSRQSNIIGTDLGLLSQHQRNFDSVRIPEVEFEGKYYVNDPWFLSGSPVAAAGGAHARGDAELSGPPG